METSPSQKPDKNQSMSERNSPIKTEEASRTTAGWDSSPNSDPTMDFLRATSTPVTRENYLEIAYLGEVPDPFPAELEALLPPELQINSPDETQDEEQS